MFVLIPDFVQSTAHVQLVTALSSFHSFASSLPHIEVNKSINYQGGEKSGCDCIHSSVDCFNMVF